MSRKNSFMALVNLAIFALLTMQLQAATAQATSSSIAACANTKTGALRLATPACNKSERKVAWGVQGPQGPSGTNGSNATVSTKTVTIRYVGNGTNNSECGDGQLESWNFHARTFKGTWYDSSSLTSSSNWVSNSYCSITLKVIQ